MTYRVMDIAKYILNKCVADNCPISNLQLQKILYYVQREFLQKKGCPCFEEELEAWQFGPVAPTVYYKYCGFGSLKIREASSDIFQIPETDKNMINAIVDQKKEKMPWELVNDTHEEGKAWARVYQDGEGYKEVIPKVMIQKYG